MALERAVGGIAIPTTVGADFSVTGLTFQPKALLVWCNAQTTPSHQNSNARWGVGFAGNDGGTLTQGYVAGWDQDGVATTVGGASSGTGVLLRALSAVSTVDLELVLLSFDSGGFTIDAANPFSTAGIILNYMALGGTDITAARVFDWFYTNTTPQDVTVNTGFGKPNLVLSQWSDTDVHPTAHTAAAARDPHYNMSVITNNGTTVEDGMSDGVSDRANANQAMWLHQRMGRMISGVNNVPPLTYEAHVDTTLANWPTDGFRVVKDLIGSGAPTSLPVVSLALKGTFQAKLAEVSTSTTLNANIDMNAGFAPRAAFLFGGNLPPATTLRDADSGVAQALSWGVGAYDGTNQRSASVGGDDGNASAQTGMSYSATRAWMSTDPNATLTSPPTLAGENTASFSGNNVRLTQSDADTIARGVMVLALGDAAAGGTPIQMTLTPVTETDAAVALSFTKTIRKTLTPVTETDAAVALSYLKTIYKSLTPVTETDTAVALTFSQGAPIQMTLTPVTETDVAVPLVVTKPIVKTLTPVTETDQAPALIVTKAIRKTLVPVTEADSAVGLVVTKPIRKTLTPVSEADTAVALVVTKPIRVSITPVTETDTAVPLVVTKPIVKTLTPVTETDTALPLSYGTSGPIVMSITPVTELDEAVALSVTKTIFKSLTPVTETSTAVPLSVVKPILKSLVPVVELDEARPLTVTKPIRVTIAPVTETDEAVALTYTTVGPRYYSIEPVTEFDQAVPLSYDIPAGLKPVMHRGIIRDRTIDGPVIVVTPDQAQGPVQLVNGIPQDARGYMIVLFADGPGETLASGWPIVRVT